MRDWADFFAAELGASATLAGLVTVAISINLARILEIEHLPARAAESLFAITAVFALSAFALFPAVSLPLFGGLAIAAAALSLVFGARNQLLWRRQVGWAQWERQIVNLTGRLASNGPLAIGGVLLLSRSEAGIAWIATGVIATLVVAVLNAWVLLVEIVR